MTMHEEVEDAEDGVPVWAGRSVKRQSWLDVGVGSLLRR
jgi:hypothetical protein